MKMRDLIFSALVVVAIASSPSFAQIVISNNFDGDDTNDLGGAFVLSSNGLEDNDASVPATGLIQFQDVDTNNPTVGFTSSTAVDLTSFDGFTVEWVVASGVNTADIRSNGWFFGVQDGVGMQGVGDSLWNNVPDAIGVTLFRGGDFSQAEFAESFASDGAGESFASVGTSDAAAAADGFTISLTLNSDNTWSVSSVGLDTGSGELSGSGTLVAADTYASFADNLFASTFWDSVSLLTLMMRTDWVRSTSDNSRDNGASIDKSHPRFGCHAHAQHEHAFIPKVCVFACAPICFALLCFAL